MNVIFLDFDGTLCTYHQNKITDIEKKIKILSDICSEYDCKIVIESSSKDAIDEETGDIYSEWVQSIFDLFNKYNIECIGRTPNVEKRYSKNTSLPMWKEDEIRLYLFRHPEIEHYCVLDDDDTRTMFHWSRGDLDKVKDHLVTPMYYSDDPEEEGLLPIHKEEVREALKKENEVKKLILRKQKKQR